LSWLLIPWWLFSHARSGQLTPGTKALGALLYSIDGLVAVVVTLALGRLLRQRFQFQRVQRYVTGLAVTYSLGTFLGVLGFFLKFHLYFVVAVYTAPTALLLAALGLGLLHLPGNRSSFMRPFAYLQIGTGMLMASYYLASLAPLCGAVGGIVLMLLFIEQAAGDRVVNEAGGPSLSAGI
jgi:hypothetical protein